MALARIGENCEKWQNGGKCWMSNLWSIKGEGDGGEGGRHIQRIYKHNHMRIRIWTHTLWAMEYPQKMFVQTSVTSRYVSPPVIWLPPCSPPPPCLADFHSSNWISLHALCHFSLWFWFGFFFLADCIFDSQSGPKMCQIVNNIWNDLIPY